MPSSWQKRFNASSVEVRSRIADPVDPEVLDELATMPDFLRAYDPDGLGSPSSTPGARRSDAARVHGLVPRPAAPRHRGTPGVTDLRVAAGEAVTPRAPAGATCPSSRRRIDARRRWGSTAPRRRSSSWPVGCASMAWSFPGGHRSGRVCRPRSTCRLGWSPTVEPLSDVAEVAVAESPAGPRGAAPVLIGPVGGAGRGPRGGQCDAPDQPHHHARVRRAPARGGGGLHARAATGARGRRTSTIRRHAARGRPRGDLLLPIPPPRGVGGAARLRASSVIR